MTLRAVIFDFDGVLVDTEPIHLRLFQEALRPQGIVLTKREYYAQYLGLDDRSFFRQIYRDHKKRLATFHLERLLSDKTRAFKRFVKDRQVFLPGAKRAVKMLARRYPLGIVSGALRREIALILRGGGLDGLFPIVIGADDVRRNKPYPDGYRKALALFNHNIFSPTWPLAPQECLAVEDSHWGIAAARKAGMRCLAVATSYPKSKLRDADLVLSSLRELTIQNVINAVILRCPSHETLDVHSSTPRVSLVGRLG